MKTTQQAFEDLREAWRDLMFEFAYTYGFVWIINRLPGYRLKGWMQERLDKKTKTKK